jgi:RNA polymerase sigma-70 factor (ECF subfamily)
MSVLATEVGLETRREAIAPRVDADASLLAALRRGDPSAAERLVGSFGDRAYRLALRITRNAADAEEVVQDAFCNVIRKVDTFRGDSAFRSWLYRVVSNAAYQKVRGTARRRAELSLDEVLPAFRGSGEYAESIVDWSSAVDDPSRRIEVRVALTAAMADLPADYHTVVLWHDVEGLSTADIAAALGISVANVKSRLHRARLFLRKRLTEAMTA